MAERRMLTRKITESDAFLEMPHSAQALYLHLNLEADDDGFINAPKKVMRLTGTKKKDLELLINKKFVLAFEDGLIVIKHWRMHNYLRHDRYHPTQYQNEFAMLTLDDENIYHLDSWQPDGNQTATEDRLGKDRLGKDRLGKELFASHDESSEAIYSIRLKEKDTFQPIYREDIEFLQTLYPEVNVEQEIRNMVGWSEGNDTKRKTKSGIKSFITRWLNREQNKVGKVPDQLKDKAREAYIKDVEMKQAKAEKGDGMFYDTERTK